MTTSNANNGTQSKMTVPKRYFNCFVFMWLFVITVIILVSSYFNVLHDLQNNKITGIWNFYKPVIFIQENDNELTTSTTEEIPDLDNLARNNVLIEEVFLKNEDNPDIDNNYGSSLIEDSNTIMEFLDSNNIQEEQQKLETNDYTTPLINFKYDDLDEKDMNSVKTSTEFYRENESIIPDDKYNNVPSTNILKRFTRNIDSSKNRNINPQIDGAPNFFFFDRYNNFKPYYRPALPYENSIQTSPSYYSNNIQSTLPPLSYNQYISSASNNMNEELFTSISDLLVTTTPLSSVVYQSTSLSTEKDVAENTPSATTRSPVRITTKKPSIEKKIAKDNKITIHQRKDWNAKETNFRLNKFPKIPLNKVVIAHTAGSKCYTTNDCCSIVKNIQDYHVGSKNFGDIGYNFIIGNNGEIYEGRGWDYYGAHTYGYNKDSLGISFTGNFVYDTPAKVQIDASLNLLNLGVKLGKLNKNYKIYAHNQLIATLSPGKNLIKEIKKWPHWSSEKPFST